MSIDPVTVFVGATAVILLLLPQQRSVRGGYQPRGPARSFDETFPPQPTVVRKGVVLKRRELNAPRHSISAVSRSNPPLFPHYAFRIKCDDELGAEEIDLQMEKNGVNVLAEEGAPVVVTSTRNRLDYRNMCHTVTAA